MGSKSLTLISGQELRFDKSRTRSGELITYILQAKIPRSQIVNKLAVNLQNKSYQPSVYDFLVK